MGDPTWAQALGWVPAPLLGDADVGESLQQDMGRPRLRFRPCLPGLVV